VNIVFMQVVLLLGNGMAGTRLLNHNLWIYKTDFD
jgi:hypothetical protein